MKTIAKHAIWVVAASFFMSETLANHWYEWLPAGMAGFALLDLGEWVGKVKPGADHE